MMGASKYLPPFTTEERGTVAEDRAERETSEAPEPEVTYADFLGDEVDDQ
jgi:hypothetical protein